jgi:hypothetical protein
LQGDSWSAEDPRWDDRSPLAGDGFVAGGALPGAAIVRVRIPENEKSSALLRDSSRLGSYVSKALRLRRFVGTEQIPITSLGPALAAAQVGDRWGRRWQTLDWSMAFSDVIVVAAVLPQPDGCAAVVKIGATRDRRFLADEIAMLTDYVFAPYTGRFDQWRDFLAIEDQVPPALRDARFQLEPGKPFAVHSERFALEVSLMIQDTSDRSSLNVALAPIPSGAGAEVRHGIVSLYVVEDEQRDVWAHVMRVPRPPQELGGELMSQWSELTRRQGFWSGQRRPVDGVDRFGLTFPVAAKSTAVGGKDPAAMYALTFSSGTDDFDDEAVSQVKERLKAGFRALE